MIIGVFIDGLLRDSRNWAYPRIDSVAQTITYEVGDSVIEKGSSMSWCVASAHLVSLPLSESDSPTPTLTFELVLFR